MKNLTKKKNKSMTTQELVKLLKKSSETHPYTGKLTTKENIEEAIALAKLFKEFALKGMQNEAGDIPVSKWDDAIDTLQGYLTEYWPTEI